MRDHGRLRLKAGRLIDPRAQFDGPAELVIQDGQIVGYARECGSADSERLIELPHYIVCPAFVDLHTHLREPGQEVKETIASGTRAAAAGGFGTVCALANTDPPADTASDVAAILAEVRRSAEVRVHTYGTVTKRRQGAELSELADLAAAGAVAFSDDSEPIRSSRLLRHALEYSRIVGRPIVDHCEDAELAAGAVMHEGEVAAWLGLRGQPAAAEEVAVARDLALARFTGGRLHLAHLSTAGAVDLVRAAKAEGLSITAEATPHHLTLTEALVARTERGGPYDPNAKVSPPLRTDKDRAALVEALADGTIDAIATDHAPHTAVDKQCEFDHAAFGMSGLETALGLVLRLVREGRLGLLQLVERMTVGPARAFGLPAGTLESGQPADLVFFDPEEEWTVEPEQFFSRGKNTPLAGMTLRGRVKATMVGGRLVHGALV
jgi:dihydroorotase